MIETRAENVLNLKDAQDTSGHAVTGEFAIVIIVIVSSCFLMFFMCGTITLK